MKMLKRLYVFTFKRLKINPGDSTMRNHRDFCLGDKQREGSVIAQ